MDDAVMWCEEAVSSLDPVLFSRVIYLVAASAILVVRLLPPLRKRFLVYGARQAQSRKPASNGSSGSQPLLSKLLDAVAELKVPHYRFSDFYIFSLVCTAFWIHQIRRQGFFIQALQQGTPKPISQDVLGRIILCFLLLGVQSSRRLYECLFLSKSSSSSRMWIGHYLIGLTFYFFVNIAIFVDHLYQDHSLLGLPQSPLKGRHFMLNFDAAALAMFAMASVKQHQYHEYLSSLKKYTLPDQHAFCYIIAPHYTAECFIYLSISILAAPQGTFINLTVLCALVFVVVNLGVTAVGTKKWMLNRFAERKDEIEKRSRMIPWIF